MSYMDNGDGQERDGDDPGLMRRELLALLAAPSGNGEPSNLRAILQALIDMAKDKELAAIREIFDRVDGKAPTLTPIVDSNRKVIFEWVSNEQSASASHMPSAP